MKKKKPTHGLGIGFQTHNFIGTDDAKLHSLDPGQVGRREGKALVHGRWSAAKKLPATSGVLHSTTSLLDSL